MLSDLWRRLSEALPGFWQWLHEINWLGWWPWLGGISQSQATFLGWVVGVVTLVGGALLNAHLNRKRDDRLRREEQRGVATALKAELAGCRRALLLNAEMAGSFVTPDLTYSIRIMPEMVSKFGLLDEETIKSVANAYLAVEEHGEQLLLLHGARLVDPEHLWAREAQSAEETRTTISRRLISYSADEAPKVSKVNRQPGAGLGYGESFDEGWNDISAGAREQGRVEQEDRCPDRNRSFSSSATTAVTRCNSSLCQAPRNRRSFMRSGMVAGSRIAANPAPHRPGRG